MGMFDFFSSPDVKRADEVRKGTVAPDRSERKRCWEARDGYYRCLDKHKVIDSLNGDGKKIADRECANEDKLFQQDCASAWVTYFKKYRVADYQKKQTMARLEKEGANQMPGQSLGDLASSSPKR